MSTISAGLGFCKLIRICLPRSKREMRQAAGLYVPGLCKRNWRQSTRSERFCACSDDLMVHCWMTGRIRRKYRLMASYPDIRHLNYEWRRDFDGELARKAFKYIGTDTKETPYLEKRRLLFAAKTGWRCKAVWVFEEREVLPSFVIDMRRDLRMILFQTPVNLMDQSSCQSMNSVFGEWSSPDEYNVGGKLTVSETPAHCWSRETEVVHWTAIAPTVQSEWKILSMPPSRHDLPESNMAWRSINRFDCSNVSLRMNQQSSRSVVDHPNERSAWWFDSIWSMADRSKRRILVVWWPKPNNEQQVPWKPCLVDPDE